MEEYTDVFNPYFLNNLKNEPEIKVPMAENKQRKMTALPEDAAVTMAYVPFQLDNETYEAEKALMEGTLFPVLNKPFKGGMRK